MSKDSNRRFAGFTFFPDKWMSHTTRLSSDAYRAYHLILCHMWLISRDQCSMKNTDEALSVAIFGKYLDKKPKKKIEQIAKIRAMMDEILHPDYRLLEVVDGKLVSKGLEKEYERCMASARKSKAGHDARYGAGEDDDLGSASRQALGSASKTRQDNLRRSKPPDTNRGSNAGVIPELGGIIADMTERHNQVADAVMTFQTWLPGPYWGAWLRTVITKLFECGGAAAALDLGQIVIDMEQGTNPRKRGDRDSGQMYNPKHVLAKKITEVCKRYGAKPWPNFPEG